MGEAFFCNMSQRETTETYADHLKLSAQVAKRFHDRPAHSIRHSNPEPVLDKPAPVVTGPRPASYRVFPWSVNDPTEAKRKVVKDPSDDVASPLGWHSVPHSGHPDAKDISQLRHGWSKMVKYHGLQANDTRGNNVYAQENWEGLDNWEANYRPDGTDDLRFRFHLGWNKTDHADETGHIEPKDYIDAAISELFYTCNEVSKLFHGWAIQLSL